MCLCVLSVFQLWVRCVVDVYVMYRLRMLFVLLCLLCVFFFGICAVINV